MRKFTIRSGKFAGTHNIYDNKEEAAKDGIKNIKSPWHTPDVVAGDWCESDDGYIIQCLHRYKLINKRHRNGQYTDTFRFCNGTVYVYYDRNRSKHIKNFYGAATAIKKNSLSETSLGRFMPLKKKHFVALVSQGVNPYTAYIRAYRTVVFSREHAWTQVNKLLDDPLVRRALMENLKPFIEQVEEAIRKKTEYKSVNDWLVNQLVNLMIDVKLPAREKRANVQLIISLFGEKLGVIEPHKSKREIQEADYEIMPPPALGTSQVN